MPGGTRFVDNKYYYQQVSGINAIYDVENESEHRLTSGYIIDVDDFNRPVIDNGTTLTPSVMLVKDDFDNEQLIYSPVEPPTIGIRCKITCNNGYGNFTEWCGVNWVYGYDETDSNSSTTMWNQGEYVGLRNVRYEPGEDIGNHGDMLSTEYEFNVALDGKDSYIQVFLVTLNGNYVYSKRSMIYRDANDTVIAEEFPPAFNLVLLKNELPGVYSDSNYVEVLTLDMNASEMMQLKQHGVFTIELEVGVEFQEFE